MRQSKSRIYSILTGLAGVILLTGFDQFTKSLAVNHLKSQSSMVLIPGVFELSYLENRGAAWGMLENLQWIFVIFTLVILAALCYSYCRVPMEKKYKAFRVLAVVLASGAAGNAIDRIFSGYVVDFFYISLIDFPVFNVADCYVTVSLALFLLIYRKEVWKWIHEE